MKKLMKSRIFLVIITMFATATISICATNNYNSNSILYKTSTGESMTVNEALNDLYENNSTATIIYLGEGTAFDLSSYNGYENFTVDNFFVEVTSFTAKANNDLGQKAAKTNTTTINIVKSYDAPILTITGLSNSYTSSYPKAYASASNPKVYLVI